jgi:hydroxymethylpyrimidine/phosphomethylpyrimidine kinase
MLFAQNAPVQNVNAQRNPNLAEAQKLCGQAFQEVTKAQKANKYDMKGHAAKAKQLLIQASQELSEADKIADSAHPGKSSGPGTTSKHPLSGVTNKLQQ